MGAITREKGVLKLVHPGRYIEIHTQPITAAEVMRKNPRHSITRPDVFEFTYIVVKAEAILVLGKVFFIVPVMSLAPIPTDALLNIILFGLCNPQGFVPGPNLPFLRPSSQRIYHP